jgi:hypothetical protein
MHSSRRRYNFLVRYPISYNNSRMPDGGIEISEVWK